MTVNVEDRAGLRDNTEFDDEAEEPRLGGTDIFRGGLVIGLAMLIGGFVMLRGLTQDSTTASGATTTALESTADGETDSGQGGVATTTTGGIDTTAGLSSTDPAQAAADGGATVDDQAMVDGEATVGDEVMVDGEITPEGPDTNDGVDDTGLRPPADVRVLVLNGAAQRQGVAASGTEVLKAASYNTAAPKNATKTTAQSVILYMDGYQAEAQAVAQAFGSDLTTIVQPFDPADPPTDELQDAHVIVVIGEDDIIPIS